MKLYVAVLLLLPAVLLPRRVLGSDVDCGLKCLHVATTALGNDDSYSDFLSEAPPPVTERGYSLQQLSDHADSLGFETQLVKTTFDRLELRARRQPFACIAWLPSEHFVLLGDSRDRQVWVIDPPKEHWSDHEVFQARWNGQALLISNVPLDSEDELTKRFGLSTLAWGISMAGLVGLGISVFVVKRIKHA